MAAGLASSGQTFKYCLLAQLEDSMQVPSIDVSILGLVCTMQTATGHGFLAGASPGAGSTAPAALERPALECHGKGCDAMDTVR